MSPSIIQAIRVSLHQKEDYFVLHCRSEKMFHRRHEEEKRAPNRVKSLNAIVGRVWPFDSHNQVKTGRWTVKC